LTDIASLGLVVDSRQVTSANAALDQLAAKSAAAGAATDKLAAAGSKSETVMRAIQAAADRNRISFDTMNKRVDDASASHAKLSAASATAATGIVNLANAAAGTGGGSLANAADKSDAALSRLGNTLTRRVIFAFAAKEARDLAAYIWNLNSALAATGDTAGRTGTGGQQFQGLQTAAAYKGVDNSTFNGAMLAFNQQIDLAKSGLGDLKTLLSSNGKTVSDTATTFGVVANLVKNAGSEAQKFSILQQAGLPASVAFVKLMEQGGDAITRQSIAAAKLTDTQLEDAQRLDARWQKLWVDFTLWGKRAALDVGVGIQNIPTPFAHQGTWIGAKLQGMGFDRPEDPNSPRNQGIGLLKQGQGTQLGTDATNKIYNATGGFGTVKTPNATDDNARQKQILSQDNQRISQLGDLATVSQLVTQKQNELNIAGRSGYGITLDQQKAVVMVTQAQAENARVTAQAGIGVFDFAKASKAAADTMQTWIDRKLIDPKNMDQFAAATTYAQKNMEKLAETAAIAGAPLEGLKRLQIEAGSVRTQLDQFAVTSANAVTPALRDMLNGTTSLSAGFKGLGLTIVQALEDAIIKLTIVKPLLDGLSFGFGGGVSLFGSLFGGSGSVGNGGIVLGGAGGPGQFASGFHSGGIVGAEPTFARSVPSTIFTSAPRFHSGLMPNEFPAILQKGEGVFTRGQMAAMGGSGGTEGVIHIDASDNRTISIGAGASPESVAQLKAAFQQDRAERASQIVDVVKRAKQQRHL
jgi:hypothetical protein